MEEKQNTTGATGKPAQSGEVVNTGATENIELKSTFTPEQQAAIQEMLAKSKADWEKQAQSETDRRVSQALKAKSEENKKLEDELKKKMTQEELNALELKQKDEANIAKESELLQMQRNIDLRDALDDSGLSPKEYSRYITGNTKEEMLESAKGLKVLLNKAREEGRQSVLKETDNTPKKGDGITPAISALVIQMKTAKEKGDVATQLKLQEQIEAEKKKNK